MKNYLIMIIFGAMLLLTACTNANADTDLEWTHNNNQGETANYIAEAVSNLEHTPQEAVDKISSLYEGTVVEVELDGSDGLYYYEIEIVNGDVKYDSKVNADNLEIIKLEKGGVDSKEALDSVRRITPEAALDIADGEVDGEITGWELEDDEYEIMMEADDNLIKIEIDALTAELLDKEVKKDEENKIDGSGGKGDGAADDEAAGNENDEESGTTSDQGAEESVSEKEPVEETGNREEKSSESKKEEQQSKDDSEQQKNEPSDYNNGILTPEAAIDIALNEVGGIVIEWEYDDDDFEYEIELNVNGEEVEVEINSINGVILEIEYDD